MLPVVRTTGWTVTVGSFGLAFRPAWILVIISAGLLLLFSGARLDADSHASAQAFVVDQKTMNLQYFEALKGESSKLIFLLQFTKLLGPVGAMFEANGRVDYDD